MRMSLIFGFLGSGKTTLVRRILEQRAADHALAVIVNEFGDVGIDGEILEGKNVDVMQFNSGCLCCTLKGSLLSAIEEIRNTSNVDEIIVETTGLADPDDLIDDLSSPEFRQSVTLNPIVTVVNAPKFLKIREMLGPFYTDQVERADIILLNKTDLGTATELEQVRLEIARINPKASLILTEQSEFDLDLILYGGGAEASARRSTHGDNQGHSHEHEHVHFQSFVLDAAATVEQGAVEAFFGGLPETLFRAKGFMNIGPRRHLVQFSSGHLDISPAATEGPLQMVFIGKNLDQDGIQARFAFAGASADATQ